jgi:hypothetical protein
MCFLKLFGDAKIGDFDFAFVVNEDVLGFNITVDLMVLLVDVLKAREDLSGGRSTQ